MKRVINKLIEKNRGFYILISPLLYVYRLFKYYLVSDKIAIKKKFKKVWGYELNLNQPTTFSEKLQWLKLYDRKDWYTQCADKMTVRDYLFKILGTDQYLIPLYFATENYKEIKLSNMPENGPYVVKCSHDNNSYKIIKDGKNENWSELQKYYRKRLNSVNLFWSNREWPYKNIAKRYFMVEAFLQSKSDNYKLQEYKFHCFNRELKIIDLYEVGEDGAKRARILDSNFIPYPKDYSMGYNNTIEKLQLPTTAVREEMLELVKKISQNFEYQIRIDMYHVDSKLYIGELTFFDGAGFDFIKPNEFNEELGGMLKLPTDNFCNHE